MPTEAWYHQIHQRLLADDPTASAELVETVLEALVEALGKQHPRLRGSELLVDAVIDTLMSYIKRPAQFDPTRLTLFRYLTDLPPSVFGYLLSNQLVKWFQTLWCSHVICPFYSCISPYLAIK